MLKSSTVALCILSAILFSRVSAQQAVAPTKTIELLNHAERIIFLGDSITQQGHYVAMFEAWLQTRILDPRPVVINVGLSSETVSGLSEEGHAGGRFPRPDLAERLDRVLKVTQPDLVFACYGINCGIYQPFDEERFRAYRNGMEHLRAKVEDAGATLVQITPPCYDDMRGAKDFSYNAVLGRYADYLLEGRKQGRQVVDLHGAMTAELAKRRQSHPEFTFQRDAVHPDVAGHWFMAGCIIRWFGDDQAADAASPAAMLEARGIPSDVYDLVAKRMAVRRNAYLSAAGHTRPGVRAGLPIEEAEQQARELTEMIQDLRNGQAGF
jgi:lysophospholipase L1-like esterase